MGGRKTFVTNTVLTAADVQDFLMDQAVMTFADSTARGTAISSPTEGMVSYLSNTDALEVFNGAAWKQFGSTTGSIVQVQSTIKTDSFSASVGANSLTALTGLSVSITPKNANNRILVMADISVANSSAATVFVLKRGATQIGIGDAAGSRQRRTVVSDDNVSGFKQNVVSFNVLDSPATTSSTTYSLDIGTGLAGGAVTHYVNRTNTDTDAASIYRTVSTITVIEVVG